MDVYLLLFHVVIINLIIMAGFLAFTIKKYKPNIFLFLLLVQTIFLHLCNHLLFTDNHLYGYVFYLDYSLAFFYGPLIFFFVRKQISGIERNYTKTLLHLLPGLQVFLLYIYYLLSPIDFDAERAMTIYNNPNLLTRIIVGGLFLHMVSYLAWCSIKTYKIVKGWNDKKDSPKYKRLRSIHIFSVTQLSIITIAIITSFIFDTSVLRYQFMLSFMNYLVLMYHILSNSDFFKRIAIQNEPCPDELLKIFNLLDDLLVTEKLYLNSSITISDLAKTLNVSPGKISEAIKIVSNMNSPNFINKYRIEETLRLMKSHPDYKIEYIAKKSGFNHRSSFYDAFKLYTGTVPSAYKKSNITD